MKIKITAQPPRGKIRAIAAKSLAHRAALAAALCEKNPTTLIFRESSADIETTLTGLSALGARAEIFADKTRVTPAALPPSGQLDCRESGSTLRFMLPVLAAKNLPTQICGGGRLPERPLSPLREILAEHGATFSAEKLPLTIAGKLRAGKFILPGNVSSQYVSGLLFALPLLDAASEICLTSPLESRGYVEITIAVLRGFGVEIDRQSGAENLSVRGGQKYQTPQKYRIEGDWSNAAFFFAANHLGANLEIENLNPQSAQPDRAIINYLRSLTAGTENVLTMENCPDLLPILCVAAAAKNGKTHFVNAARLRLKESDRLAAITAGLRALGGEIEPRADGLTVCGRGKLSGGECDAFNDHRLAMALTVAALICDQPVIINGAEAVNKSYPRFFDDWRSLGGNAAIIA